MKNKSTTKTARPNDQEHLRWLAHILTNGDVMSEIDGEYHQGSSLEMNDGIFAPGYLRRIIRLTTMGIIQVERCKGPLGSYQMVRLTDAGQKVVSPVIAQQYAESRAKREKAAAKPRSFIARLFGLALLALVATFGAVGCTDGPPDDSGLVCPAGDPTSFPAAVQGFWSQTDLPAGTDSHVIEVDGNGVWFQTTTINGVEYKSQGTWSGPAPGYIVSGGGREPACTAYVLDPSGLALTTISTSEYSPFGSHSYVAVSQKLVR